MQNVVLQLPDSFEFDKFELTVFLAAKLYEKGKLSLGQAAELAGLTKPAFAEILGKYDVSIFNYSADELKNDVFNA
jgi:predicted HTH domain antitoxin